MSVGDLRNEAIGKTPPGARFECAGCGAFCPGIRPHRCGHEEEELREYLALVERAGAVSIWRQQGLLK